MTSHSPIHTPSPVTVGSQAVDVVDVAIPGGRLSRVSIQIKNTGSVAISKVSLLRKVHPDGDWLPPYWGGGQNPMVLNNVSATGDAVAPGAIAWADFECWAATEMKIQAQTAGGNTTVVVLGSCICELAE